MITKNSFDFTSIPSELIYQDRCNLDDFDVENPQSINFFINDILYKQYAHFSNYEEFAISIFNCAYYFYTIALADSHPDRRFGAFRQIAHYRMHFNEEYSAIILSIVVLYIYHGKWDNNLKMQRLETALLDELRKDENYDIYESYFYRLYKLNKACPDISEFTPRLISNELLASSVKNNNWMEPLTNDDEKQEELIIALGKNKDEQELLARFIHEQTHHTVAKDNNLEQHAEDEELRLLKEELETYHQEPFSDNPHDKVRLEVVCKLLEESGANFDAYGNKAEAARLAHYITGLPFSTCKNYMTNRDLNTTEHNEEVLKTNTSIKKIGINWQL